MKKNRIVFFGTPVFAVPVLKELLDTGYDIAGVFTGHGPVEVEAQKLNLKTFTPESLKKDDGVFEQFKSLNPDLCVVAAYGKIIPAQYLEIPKHGFLNIHPSLLPKYRGPSPVQTSILNGDTETGVSIMLIDEQVDHGPLLASESYKIPSEKNNLETVADLFILGGKLLIDIIPKYISGEIKPKPQNDSEATFTKMFSREDGKIDWNEPDDKIYNQIRSLNPEPGTWTKWPVRPGQSKILNIKKTELSDRNSSESIPGTVIRLDNYIAVATKKCYLILKQIQLEGGKEMDAQAFANGHPDLLNSTLE